MVFEILIVLYGAFFLCIADLSEAASRAQSASLESGIDGSETPLAPPSPARSTNGQEESAYFERGSDDTVSLMYSKPSHISEEYG